MTSTEFLKTKNVNRFTKDESGKGIDLVALLEVWHQIESGNKIDADKKFENLTSKHLTETGQPTSIPGDE